MNHVILIGFMGCGKSSVGKTLAEALLVPFVDTDELIERRNGRLIRDIFRESGEDFFRDLETETLALLLESNERMVIAAGGGLPLRPENREYIRQLGTAVYLLATEETLVARLRQDDTRPLLQGGELEKKIERLMAEREEIYRETADLQIVTDGKEIYEIVQEVRKNVG